MTLIKMFKREGETLSPDAIKIHCSKEELRSLRKIALDLVKMGRAAGTTLVSASFLGYPFSIRYLQYDPSSEDKFVEIPSSKTAYEIDVTGEVFYYVMPRTPLRETEINFIVCSARGMERDYSVSVTLEELESTLTETEL